MKQKKNWSTKHQQAADKSRPNFDDSITVVIETSRFDKVDMAENRSFVLL